MDNSDFIDRARHKIKQGLSDDDLIKRLLSFSDSLEKGENTIFEQLHDLYFLYYPEAASLLAERDKFIDALKEACDRSSVSGKTGVRGDSMGYDLEDSEIQLLSMSVNEINNISDLKKLVDERLQEIMRAKYPNTTAVLGPELAAEMLSLSGGSHSLINMPSSKIQVIGAEKAMFAARKRKLTPKYGIIYNHAVTMSVPDRLKGKAAKIIAAYASLAVKTDVLSRQDKSGEILEKMSKAIDKMRKKNGN